MLQGPEIRYNLASTSPTRLTNTNKVINSPAKINSKELKRANQVQLKSLKKRAINSEFQNKIERALGGEKKETLAEQMRALGLKYDEATLEKTFKGKPKAFQEFKKLVSDLSANRIHDSVKKALGVNGKEGEKKLLSFKRQLIEDSIKVMKDPLIISQENKGVCGAAEAERMLAREKPEEYLRLVRELVTEGKAKLERWHRTFREKFLTELALSQADSLDALNARLWVWIEQVYHRNPHSGLGMDTK